MTETLANRYYYLDNFETVLRWIEDRYADLLDQREHGFITAFNALPIAARALFVRMAMRKGDLFRASKLHYEEIGCVRTAASDLIRLGWIDNNPMLTAEQLFALLRKRELAEALSIAPRDAACSKAALLEATRAQDGDARRLVDWYPACTDVVYAFCVGDLCDRIRLMFFGNLHQQWSEFVLSDLGVYLYEKVAFSSSSRAFGSRADVDDYLRLHVCRERLDDGTPLIDIVQELHAVACVNPWLRQRRAKLLFLIAQRYERQEEWHDALALYTQCGYPGARVRSIRVQEKNGQTAAALAAAELAQASPESDAEAQHLVRIVPRLRRKLGRSRVPACVRLPVTRIDLTLPAPQLLYSIEQLVATHLEQADADAPIYYVENTLVNSLFGLLCWDAIFMDVPGAFFHPFQAGPADLHSPDFCQPRAMQFATCLYQLDSQCYQQTIRQNFHCKAGIQTPFVSWHSLSDTLLERALACLPAAHLARWFERMLCDIRANCTGFPDLIQFWPAQRRYRMIEVKGPGDRLQDNQLRWLELYQAHDMPVAVCYVQWEQQAEAAA